jgi:hypothetical protein
VDDFLHICLSVNNLAEPQACDHFTMEDIEKAVLSLTLNNNGNSREEYTTVGIKPRGRN